MPLGASSSVIENVTLPALFIELALGQIESVSASNGVSNSKPPRRQTNDANMSSAAGGSMRQKPSTSPASFIARSDRLRLSGIRVAVGCQPASEGVQVMRKSPSFSEVCAAYFDA